MMPTKFEREAIRFIVEHEAPKLLSNLPSIKVTSRSHNGSGCYVDLECGDTDPDKAARKLSLGKSVCGDVAGMKFGVGFMLFIDDGMISAIEIFSHGGEEIPKSITKFKLSYA